MLKKNLLIVLSIAAVTACSKDEIKNVNSNPNGANCITVSPVVPKASVRGTNATISVLNQDPNGFYVVAYGNNAFYFNRTKAIYSANGKEGITTQEGFFLEKNYAWPTYDLTFAAWYPTVLPDGGGSVTGAYKNDGTLMPGQYVSQPKWDADGNLEIGQYIKGFVPATDYAKQTDIVIARTKVQSSNYKEGTQPVILNFRHILSKVSIKAAKKEGDQIKVEIAKVELRNIPSKADFDFRGSDDYQTNGHYGDADVPSSVLIPFDHWKLDVPTTITEYSDATITKANMQRYPCALNAVVTVGPEVSSAKDLLNDDNMLLVPMDFNGNYADGYLKAWNQTITEEGRHAVGAYLALTMRVWKKNADDPSKYDLIYPALDTPETLKENIEGEVYGKAAAGIITSSTKWEPGKHYIYTLNFTDNGVGKTDPEEPGGGEDILGANMWFQVTVDDWAEIEEAPSF